MPTDPDPMLFQQGGGRDLYDTSFPPSSPMSSSGLRDPFQSQPVFSALGLDTIGGEPSLHPGAMLWQDLRSEAHETSDSWTNASSDMLPGVSNLSLSTPSQRSQTIHSISSEDTIGDTATVLSPTREAQQTPMTPIKNVSRGAQGMSRPPSPPISSLDDETPMKAPDEPFHGAFLYELSATPPSMMPHGVPPMTPLTEARRATIDDPRSLQNHSVRTHRSGPSISSSSAISASTPEYGSAHSIASSLDLRSPGFPHEGHGERTSPHKAPTLPYGAEMYAAMQHHQAPPYYQVPFTPQSAAAISRQGLHGPISLDEPFGTPEQFMSPLSSGGMPPYMSPSAVPPYMSPLHSGGGAPPTMSPGLLFQESGAPGGPKVMSRVASAPTLHSPLPHWSAEQERGMCTPLQEPMSFPASPASHSAHLPVNSTAMARKCYTPYAKTTPALYGSPLEMDPFYVPGGLSSSKSMNAIGSPVPLSPMTPSANRRRSRMPESTSMPGEQMTSLLEYEAAQSAARARGRNAGPPPLVVSSADKLHVCHCGRRFKRMEHLKRHNRTHTQERPHKCPVESCGKSFGRSDNLAQHLKTHYRPAGLVSRASEVAQPEPVEPARPRDRRHDPYAAAAAAAAAASAAMGAPHDIKPEPQGV